VTWNQRQGIVQDAAAARKVQEIYGSGKTENGGILTGERRVDESSNE